MIAQSEQEKRILGMAEPVAADLGLEIVRVRLSGGRRPVLQIMIDREGGALADVEDCASLSRRLSALLEVEDPISGPYALEVSTPGIDRPLTRPGDFAAWEGHLAKVELAVPLEGRRRFTGTILGEDEAGVHLQLDDNTQLSAHIHEMTKAALMLTDDLLDEATARGGLPPQPDEEGFDAYERDETDETDDNEEEDGASQ